MKYFIPILFFLSAHGQQMTQVAYAQSNGRLDAWVFSPAPKKDTGEIERDTIWADRSRWPNRVGRVVHETIYQDPADLYEERKAFQRMGLMPAPGDSAVVGTKGSPNTIQVFGGNYVINDDFDSISTYTMHRITWRPAKKKKHKSTSKTHHHKVGKVHTQKVKADVEYDSYLMFSGYGEVLDRSDGMVTIEKAKGRFYYKKVKR